MKLEELTLNRFNEDLDFRIREQALDFCRALAAADAEQLSVTGEFDDTHEYAVLDSSLEAVKLPPDAVAYYGASPHLDTDMIISAISGLRFTSPEALDRFIAEHADIFMIHWDKREYLADFARYILISVAGNFALRISLDEGMAAPLTELPEFGPLVAAWDDGMLTLRGCPPESILEILDRYTYVSVPGGDSEGKPCAAVAPDDSGLSIRELYADRNNIFLENGDVFYSGTLLKTNEIIHEPYRFENKGIDSLCMRFERSTYATVFTLDHNFTPHPLLAGSRRKLTEMLRADDRCKLRMKERLDACASISGEREYMDGQLDAVNEYLRDCFNVNQIGVSANIESSDGYVLFGKRSSNSIDAGCLYPGVNGNAEIADRNVSFYASSIYEDYPTVRTDDYRIDFRGEIGREAYAEIRQSLPMQDWDCCGLTISGSMPDPAEPASDTYGPARRRMHLNIVYEMKCGVSLSEIIDSQKDATENFESSNLYGVRVRCYDSVLESCLSSVKRGVSFVIEQKDIWESILVLIVALGQLIGREQETLGFMDVVSLVLAGLMIINFILALPKVRKGLMLRTAFAKELRLLCTESTEAKDASVARAMSRFSFHPVAYASMKIYIDRQIARELR